MISFSHWADGTEERSDHTHMVISGRHMQTRVTYLMQTSQLNITGIAHLFHVVSKLNKHTDKEKWETCEYIREKADRNESLTALTLFLLSGREPPSSRTLELWAWPFWHARWRAVFPAWETLHHVICSTRTLIELLHIIKWIQVQPWMLIGQYSYKTPVHHTTALLPWSIKY